MATSTETLSFSTVRNIISTAASASNYKYLNYITYLVDSAKNYNGKTTSSISLVNGDTLNYSINDDGYDYRVTKTTDRLLNTDKTQKYSNVLLGYTPFEVGGTSFKLYNFTKISKIDITTKSELPGAKLVVSKKDDSNTLVEEWESTLKPHYMYLAAGEYTLCETVVPEGYIRKDECINFKVEANKIDTIVMENEPKVDIPNTGAFRNRILSLLGSLFIIVGLSSYLVMLNKKNKVSE